VQVKTKKTEREFTDEFKRKAVVLLRDSGRPLTQIATELGLEPSVLRRWRSLANRAGQAASAPWPGGAAAAMPAEQVEIRHLRRELDRAQMKVASLMRWRWPDWLVSGVVMVAWVRRRGQRAWGRPAGGSHLEYC